MKKPIDFSNLTDDELRQRLEAIREARRSNTVAKRAATKKKNVSVGSNKRIVNISTEDINL